MNHIRLAALMVGGIHAAITHHDSPTSNYLFIGTRVGITFSNNRLACREYSRLYINSHIPSGNYRYHKHIWK